MIFVFHEIIYMRKNSGRYEYLDYAMIEAKSFSISTSEVRGKIIKAYWKVEVHNGFVAVFRNDTKKEVIHI